MEKEALTLEAQAIAMAARNSGGIVIAQVERIADRNTLNPRQVKIPGVLVDCVVVAEKPEYHMQTFIEPYSAAFSGEIRVPISAVAPMGLDERKIIARRAAMELTRGAVVNLGIGMPAQGTVKLSELAGIVGPRQQPVMRDLYFRPTRTLSEYTRLAERDGAIPD